MTARFPVIDARHLNKCYRTTRALDDASFTVQPGRIVGLIGPNGAGKTTVLKALVGLIRVEGELQVLGQSPSIQRSALMHDVAWIADVASLPRWMRVREVIDYVEGVHPRFDRAKCDEFLHGTRIMSGQRVRELSKGMVVQLHLALVMAIDARLLILDEPTLGLDILYRKQFYQRLVEDYFDAEKTILITTHQVEEIEHLLTDVLFIRDGRIVLETSMEVLGERFVEVLTDADHLDAACARGPIHQRALPFGKTLLLFDGVPRTELSTYGETRLASLTDVFVASMQRS